MQFKHFPLNDHELKLHDSAVETAALFKRCDAKLVVIIEEVDRLKLYGKFGQTNTFKYCLNELNLTKSVSYALRAVSRKIREVPQLLTAIENGLSVSTANKLVSQITPANQAMWIEKAIRFRNSIWSFVSPPRIRNAGERRKKIQSIRHILEWRSIFRMRL